MRKLLLVLTLFLPVALYGQNRSIDSLKLRLLSSTKVDSTKADIYYQIAVALQRIDPATSTKYIDTSATLVKQLNYKMGMANIVSFDAVRCSLEGKFDSLFFYSQQCLQIAKQYKLPLAAAKAYNGLGIYHWQTGNYSEAIKNHLAALRIRERYKDEQGIAASMANLAWVYFDNQNNKESERYGLEALELARRIDNPTVVVNAMQILANVYGSTGKYDKALQYDDETIKICNREANKRGLSQAYSNMANCYNELKLYDKALQYQQKVLEIDQFFNDKKQISDTYLNIAAIHNQKKEYSVALKWLKQSIKYATESKFKQGQRNAWQLLSTVYEQTGDYKKALDAHQNYQIASLALVNEKSNEQIARMNTRYQTEKKEQTIKLLAKENTIQKLSIVKQKTTITMIAGLLIVAFIIAVLIYNRNKLKQKALLQAQVITHQELMTKAVLDAEEHERTRIAADLHDGVGQLFSAVKMNLNGLFERVDFTRQEDRFLAENTLALVDESCKEVRVISHQMMPSTSRRSGLASDLKNFIEKIDADKLKISLVTSGFKDKLESNVETMLYRVIQETINNVIKHAQATQLNIELRQTKKLITAIIKDNGVGFDTHSHANGIGLKNILSRIEYIKGTIKYHSLPGKGTKVCIQVPV
ncbi:tetratricopeptide repeat protein [Mucilaginibacter achroorhodeus]|uniref:histidine kinase n=1 Tax=Mucilaginibacter achroorhodeus TaxID=2599294 RepID=A0A563TYY4_9SPHI|nr:sensor histidine kinase [Mucilaginibacter achroorhodeus]TWR24585.1 tetratricopeptide repeat protein [Mucilaginibacter achroorhodeus]